MLVPHDTSIYRNSYPKVSSKTILPLEIAANNETKTKYLNPNGLFITRKEENMGYKRLSRGVKRSQLFIQIDSFFCGPSRALSQRLTSPPCVLTGAPPQSGPLDRCRTDDLQRGPCRARTYDPQIMSLLL